MEDREYLNRTLLIELLILRKFNKHFGISQYVQLIKFIQTIQIKNSI